VETAKQTAVATDIWKKAKAAKDFSMFKPELEKLVSLKKQAADILMDVKNAAKPYDALIDLFEPKMTSSTITKIFDELKTNLRSVIEKCVASPRQPDISVLHRKVPIGVQRTISESLSKFVKYDVKSKNAGGRIDETEHPFSTGYFDDVRITTHYYEHDVTSSLFSILHECGHAIYGQNLRQRWMYQPIGDSCSSGFHESQSRFVENMVGSTSPNHVSSKTWWVDLANFGPIIFRSSKRLLEARSQMLTWTLLYMPLTRSNLPKYASKLMKLLTACT
jgi:carboxypeptidase Taq